MLQVITLFAPLKKKQEQAGESQPPWMTVFQEGQDAEALLLGCSRVKSSVAPHEDLRRGDVALFSAEDSILQLRAWDNEGAHSDSAGFLFIQGLLLDAVSTCCCSVRSMETPFNRSCLSVISRFHHFVPLCLALSNAKSRTSSTQSNGFPPSTNLSARCPRFGLLRELAHTSAASFAVGRFCHPSFCRMCQLTMLCFVTYSNLSVAWLIFFQTVHCAFSSTL